MIKVWFDFVDNLERNSRSKTFLALFSQILTRIIKSISGMRNNVSERDNVTEV